MGDRNVSTELVNIFEDVVSPALVLIDDHNDIEREQDIDTIQFQEEFAVKVGGGGQIYEIFRNTSTFNKMPLLLRKGILDTLYLLLRRGTYDVVRFRCHESKDDGQGIIDLLLNLLEEYYPTKELLSLSKRIIRLLGIICAPSISPAQLKRYFMFLRSPLLISNSLLHALKTMIRHDDSIVKSAPVSFFNFGGDDAGLYSRQQPDFYKNEFQICMWFRVETFNNFDRNDKSGDDDNASEQQFISCSNDAEQKIGFRVFIRRKKICIEAQEGQGSGNEVMEVDFQLRKGTYIVVYQW
jgi:hypothetical protein